MKWRNPWKFERENFSELLRNVLALGSQNDTETRKYKWYHGFWPLVFF